MNAKREWTTRQLQVEEKVGTLRFNKVEVLLTDREDEVCFTLDLPTASPVFKDPVVATLKAAQGYGVRWVRESLGVEPEVNDVSALRGAGPAKIG